MAPSSPNEQFAVEEAAPAYEKQARIDAVIIDIKEKIAKFSSGPLQPLWREKKELEKHFPSLGEIEALAPEDRGVLLRFVGRVSAALKSGSLAGSKEWIAACARECSDVVEYALSKDELGPSLEKLQTLVALHIAAEKNTNTYGNPWRHQEELNNALIDALETKRDTSSVEAITNPFSFVEGETYYVPTRDKAGNFSLQEKRIGAVIVDGKNSVIDHGGETWKLSEFNVSFTQEKLLLRDGRNYFGGLPGIPKEVADLKPDNHVEIVFRPSPGNSGLVFPCKYLGSNERELEQRYGAAFRPFAKELLSLRIGREDAEYVGEETEVSYRDIKSIHLRT